MPKLVTKLSSPENVVEMAKSDQQFWSSRDERMKDIQDLIEQDATVTDDDPDNLEVQSNDGAVILRKLAAMVGSQSPGMHVAPPGGGLKDAAQRTEDLIRAARVEMELRHASGARAPLPYDEAQSIFLRGWITGRLLLNDEEDDDFLWDYSLFDSMQVYPRYRRKGLARVSTVSQQTALEVVSDWGKDGEKLLGDAEDDEVVNIYGYYDKEQFAVATDQGWLKKPTKHSYGFVPWIITLGPGAFYRQTASDQTNFTRFVGQGILDSIADPIRNGEKVLAMLHTAVAKMADPPSVVYTNDQGEVLELDLRNGGRNVLAERDKLELLNIGPKVQDLRLLYDTYRDMTFRGSVPPILFGDNEANLTGFLANVLQGSARDLIFPYLRALETYYTLLYRSMLKMFVEHGVDMQVMQTQTNGQTFSGVTVTKLDVQSLGTPMLKVAYRDVTPKDKASLAQQASMLVRDKIISLETARDHYLDIENPVAEHQKVLGDLAYLDPGVVKFASMVAILKQVKGEYFNDQDLLQAAQMVFSQGQQGQAPGPVNNMAAQGVPPEMGINAGAPPGQELLGPAPSALAPENLDVPIPQEVIP